MSRTGYLAASLFRRVQAGLQARISSSAEPCGSAGSSAKASPAPLFAAAFLSRQISTGAPSWASEVATGDEFEHATGIEREELEARAKGIDPFHEAWLDAPFGTEDKPVEVTSSFSHRVVGVPDPNDDSIIWWAHIKEGEPPRQLVEGGEFFVLKRIPGGGHGH